jgi:tRNA U34 2-thiouridine synthase MnmA/TrmU
MTLPSDRPQPVRALVLMSGGLDSRLAACVLRDQGVAVTALAFESPFFDARRARQAAAQLGLPLLVEDFTAAIIGLVNHPPHGFGSGMNPCIDCHAAMLHRAGRRLTDEGCHFLATGEVLDQRPMSQNRRSLRIVAEAAGCPDWILRPLSAQLLDETEPERRGWVDRARLLGLHGKSRREQVRLAAHYGVTDYPQPAGGCRLTEPNYARRLRDLKQHEGLGAPALIELLLHGRHFRLPSGRRLIVGRDARDNAVLERTVRPGESLIHPVQVVGATAWLAAGADAEDVQQAAAICARYSDAPPGTPRVMQLRTATGGRELTVLPLPAEALASLRFG